MDRIERPHGLDRKRLLGTGRDIGRNLEYGPPCRRLRQCRPNVGRARLDEIVEHDRPTNRPMALDESEARARDLRRGAKHFKDLLAPRLVEKPAQNGTGLRVNGQDSARSASSSVWLGRARVAPVLRYARGSCGSPRTSRPREASGSRDRSNSRGMSVDARRSSATTFPRSVTSTTSPEATSRRY